MSLSSKLLAGSVMALAVAMSSASVGAQNYPTKPIRVVFPYPAGSAIDVTGRMIIDRASRTIGQTMLMENRPGANGIVGTTYVANAAPDGYTIHLTTTSAFMMNNFWKKDLPYDPVRSFEPISAVIDIPVALMVTERIPVKTTQEFVEYLKKRPGILNYASVGNGSFNHLLMEQFKLAAGVDMVHVPYQGAAPIVPELTSGSIDAVIFGNGTVLELIRTGKLKVLSYMSTVRTPVEPNVPAIVEIFPNMRPFGNWMGFVAPAKTPAPIIARLNEALVGAMADPAIQERVKTEGWSIIGNSPQAFRELIARDMPVVGAAFQAAGIKPE